MGKVRSQIIDSEQALAQWIGRKLANHDPSSMISAMNRKGRDKENPILAEGRTNSVLYPLKNGEVFQFTVERLNPEQIQHQRRALGEHFVELESI